MNYLRLVNSWFPNDFLPILGPIFVSHKDHNCYLQTMTTLWDNTIFGVEKDVHILEGYLTSPMLNNTNWGFYYRMDVKTHQCAYFWIHYGQQSVFPKRYVIDNKILSRCKKLHDTYKPAVESKDILHNLFLPGLDHINRSQCFKLATEFIRLTESIDDKGTHRYAYFKQRPQRELIDKGTNT